MYYSITFVNCGHRLICLTKLNHASKDGDGYGPSDRCFKGFDYEVKNKINIMIKCLSLIRSAKTHLGAQTCMAHCGYHYFHLQPVN